MQAENRNLRSKNRKLTSEINRLKKKIKELEDQIQRDQQYRQHEKEAKKIIKASVKEFIRETKIRLEESIFKQKSTLSPVESDSSLFPLSTVTESDFESNYSGDSDSGTIETTPDILRDLDLEKDFVQLFVEYEDAKSQNQQKVPDNTSTCTSSGSEYTNKKRHFRIPFQHQTAESLSYPVQRATPTNSEWSDLYEAQDMMYSIERATPTNSEMSDYHEPNSTRRQRQNEVVTYRINIPTLHSQHPLQLPPHREPSQQQPLQQQPLQYKYPPQHPPQPEPLLQQPLQYKHIQQHSPQPEPQQQQPPQQQRLQKQPPDTQQKPLQSYSGRKDIRSAKVDDSQQLGTTQQSSDLSELQLVHKKITNRAFQNRKKVASKEESGTQQLSEFEKVYRKITKRYK